jgi:hypothetical protein
MSMNPEKPRRRLFRVGLAVVAIAAIAVAIIAVRRASDDPFVVTIVDPETKQPLTNAVARVVTRWTTLRLEKLGLGLKPWVRREFKSQDGVFRIRGFRPRTDPRVEVCVPGYECVYLRLYNGLLEIAHDWRGATVQSYEVTNRVTIGMWRLPKEVSQP